MFRYFRQQTITVGVK